jgi:hypothetical protein
VQLRFTVNDPAAVLPEALAYSSAGSLITESHRAHFRLSVLSMSDALGRFVFSFSVPAGPRPSLTLAATRITGCLHLFSSQPATVFSSVLLYFIFISLLIFIYSFVS